MSYIDIVIQWVSAHLGLAFVAVFLLAFTEALPIFGGFVPGTAAIIAIAAILPKDAGSLGTVMAAAALGASFGDGLSFWLGHHYQRDVLIRWPLKNYPELVARSELFVNRHGVQSVLFGRFLPPVRALVPMLAGILHMSVQRYALTNIAAALVWAPLHVLFGALIGNSVEGRSALGRYFLIACVVAGVTLLLIWLARRLLHRNGA